MFHSDEVVLPKEAPTVVSISIMVIGSGSAQANGTSRLFRIDELVPDPFGINH